MSVNHIHVLLEAKRFDEALRALDAALAVQPENGYLWNRRGNVIQLLDQTDGPPLSEAEQCYLKALHINSKDLDALEELAHYYDLQNQPDLAKRYAKEYLRITQKACVEMSEIIEQHQPVIDSSVAVFSQLDAEEGKGSNGTSLRNSSMRHLAG